VSQKACKKAVNHPEKAEKLVSAAQKAIWSLIQGLNKAIDPQIQIE
jgi:hypothetical protein